MAFEIYDLLYSGLLIYLLFTLIQALIRSKTSFTQLKSAPKLTTQSQIDDFVYFDGELAMPSNKTPYSQRLCGYYGVVVRAEFQAKAKKPGKGMVTHRPVLHRTDSDDLPLLLKKDDLLVHLAVADNIRLIKNLEFATKRYNKAPSAEVSKVAKPKHKKFIVEESWLPVNAKMSLWGTVIDSNQNCITIGRGSNGTGPIMAYHGKATAVFDKIRTQQQRILYTIIALSLLLPIIWWFTRQGKGVGWLIFFAALVLASRLAVSLVTESPFKKNKSS